jgi:exopolysaccharide biosynthesis polyprenyl glycosylphosphotransferase
VIAAGDRLPAATHRHRRAVHFVRGAGVAAAIDIVVMLAVLTGIIFAPDLDAMPSDIDSALSMRITVRNLLLLTALTGGWFLTFWACALYDAVRLRSGVHERRAVIWACATGALLTAIIGTLTVSGGLRPIDYLKFWIATTAATVAVRTTRRILAGRVLGKDSCRVLVVGSGARAERMWRTLSRDFNGHCSLVGFIDTPAPSSLSETVATRLVGTLEDLESTLMRQAIDEVWIALPIKSHYPEIQQALHVCERVGVRTRYGADLFQTSVAWARYEELESPTVTFHVVPDDHRLAIKRAFDIATATMALVLLSPVLAAVACAVKCTSPGPVLFAQERYGLNRRRFRMLKFRTMVPNAEALQPGLESANEADGPVFKIADDPRITPLGRILRRTSLDELPQFINVLRGEMSMVGPRPLPLRDVERFTRAADMRRFSVRPGLTCLWQISGRSTLTFGDWITLDLKYIDSWSLAQDLSILCRTVPAVVRGTGAR